MLDSAGTFLFIMLYYLLVVAMVFMTIYKENSINYSTFFNAYRAMFDGVMGAADLEPYGVKHNHTVFTIVHVFFANVFLLNYLVAILGSVYEDQMEVGDFAFKCNKYWYIERYLVAFQEEWGYTELIVHAPPLNLLEVLILPSVFKQDMMLRTSRAFSLMMFWLESLIGITV